MATVFILLITHLILVSASGDSEKTVVVHGDINLAGLFQVYDSEDGQCYIPKASSVNVLEAVKWTLELLNSNDFIPGTKLGLVAFPTCGLTTKANNRTFELITDTRNQLYGNFYNKTTYQPVAAILGPAYSEEVQTTSRIISALPAREVVPQVGYSATATTLKDKNIYKNFVSVIPSDDIQVQVMVALMKKLHWNYIAVLFEDDIYGREGAKNLEKIAKDNNICVNGSYAIKVSRNEKVSADELTDVLEKFILNKMKGVVFFGGSFVAKMLLHAAKVSRFTEKITFIFSEGVSLKEEIFWDKDQVIVESLGSFVLGPPEIVFSNFTKHWEDIFSNVSYLLEHSAKNPWLEDVFRQDRNCQEDDISQCAPIMTSGRTRNAQYLYTGYSIKATLVLAHVIKEVHREACPSLISSCSKFTDIILTNKTKILMKLLSSAHTFERGFPEELQQIFTDLFPSYKHLPVYEVYQFNNCFDSSKPYCLNKIGEYRDSKLEFIENWKSVPDIAECPNKKLCSDCLPKNPQDLAYFEKGDMYVVGVVPVYHKLNSSPTGCDHIKTAHSVELAEVMSFAVQKTNSDPNLFPGKKIGLIILNSCNQRLVIQRKILNLLEMGLSVGNTSYVDVKDKIMGFIGGFSSTVTIAMADILTELGYVQISYAGTSPALTDRSKYPYFLRVVPPNNNEGITIIEILGKLKESTYVQTIYSEGAFGESCNAAFEKEAKKKNICIARQIPVIEDKYSGILDTLRKNQYAKIVVACLQSYMAVGVAKELQQNMEMGEFMLIGSQALGLSPKIINQNNKLVGSFTLSFGMNDIPGFTEYLNQMDVEKKIKNPWYKDYLEQKYQCYLKGSFNKEYGKPCAMNLPEMTSSYLQEQWTPYAYSAITTFLQGANETFDKLCGLSSPKLCSDFKNKPSELWRSVKKRKLDVYDVNKPVALYDLNGDGYPSYTIYNVQKKKYSPLEIEFVQVGQTVPNDSNLNFQLDVDRLQYAENLHLPSNCPNDFICTQCFGEKSQALKSGLAEETKGLIGGVVVLAVTIIILISIIIFKFKGKRSMSTEEQYIHPHCDQDYYATLTVPTLRPTAECNNTAAQIAECNNTTSAQIAECNNTAAQLNLQEHNEGTVQFRNFTN